MPPPKQDASSSSSCSLSDNFNHKFSGYSVWLEPCSSSSSTATFKETMKELAAKCGGPSKGVHLFAPHVTLLYNVNLSMKDGDDSNDYDVRSIKRREKECADGTELLEKCMKEYRNIVSDAANDGKSPQQPIYMDATSYYYFPYPKSADEGRGFGCVISMLLIDSTAQLQALHDAAAKVFPPDERHGEAGGTFTPHMAFVYAPESCGSMLEKWTDEAALADEQGTGESRGLLKKSEMIAGCISIWKTEGTMDEWYRVASLDLLSQQQRNDDVFRFEVVQGPSPDISICQTLREKIFINEQSIPFHVERDGKDDIATHVLCWYKAPEDDEDMPVATGRVTVDGQSVATLGRIAVLPEHRGRGLGKSIICELEKLSSSAGATRMSLTPHHYLEKFYFGLGFRRVEGEPIKVVNDVCRLITMEKSLGHR